MQLTNPFSLIGQRSVATENSCCILQELVLPCRHLGRMHLMMRGYLCHRLLPADRLQRHSRFECRRMITSWLSHGLRSSGYVAARLEIHLYPCPKKRGHLSTRGVAEG